MKQGRSSTLAAVLVDVFYYFSNIIASTKVGIKCPLVYLQVEITSFVSLLFISMIPTQKINFLIFPCTHLLTFFFYTGYNQCILHQRKEWRWPDIMHTPTIN